MKEPIDNYFTTGELAKLCKIPRKTLLYYDSYDILLCIATRQSIGR